MKIGKRSVLGIALLLLPVLVISVVKGVAQDGQNNTQFGWTVVDQRPALAIRGAIIRLGGTGTFVAGDSNDVTGGGTWTTFDATGMQTGSGTFTVTQLVKFDLAPGMISGTNFQAGLAFLSIAYSDGTNGILVVSCNLGPTSPPQVAEGFSASKGNVFYFDGYKGNAFFSLPPQT